MTTTMLPQTEPGRAGEPAAVPALSATRSGSSRLWWAAALALSLGYALALFPGLEWHSAYRGCMFKALHPESFPGDPYMSLNGPIRLSSFYLLAKLFGDAWLDDRLTLIIYFGLAVLAAIGIDKTARLFGADSLTERLLVIAVMALSHRFRSNHAGLVSSADFYAGSFASVVNIWILYYAVAGRRLGILIACLVFSWSLNAKAAWFPTVMALALMARQRLSIRQQWWALVGVLAVVAASYGAYALWVKPPGPLHAQLFDHLNGLEGTEGNPWLDGFAANLKYWVILALGWFVTPSREPIARAIRTVVVLGALLWVLGSVYLAFSPDWLKVPYLVPLSFNRATQWPQTLLYLSIAVGALVRMRQTTALGRAGMLLVLVILYGTFDIARMVQTMLLWLILFVGVRIVEVRRRRRGEASLARWDLVRVSACVLLCATLLVHARAVIRRRAAIVFLAQHGVIGDNPSAKWVGVDAYIRTHTPPNARILPIATYDYPERPHRLCYDNSLRTRTGRTTPLGTQWSALFNYDLLQRQEAEYRHMDDLIRAWRERDVERVKRELAYFNAIGYPLDYLVVDRQEAAWLNGQPFPYAPEVTIGAFTILKRRQT